VVRLLDRYESGESAEYALIFPDHSAYAFEAFVSALGQETPRDGLSPSVVPVLTDRSD